MDNVSLEIIEFFFLLKGLYKDDYKNSEYF